MEEHMHKHRGRWFWLLIVAAAVANELRKPATERQWHDRLGGVVPYDFRPPTWARVKHTLWNPDSDQILVPQVFGIGWSLNVGGLARRLGLLQQS
jgi:hypothetical protein